MDWNVIDTIYYNPAQEFDNYLKESAEELQTYLSQMAGRPFQIVTSYPTTPAVFLNIDTAASMSDSGFRIQTGSSGVFITAKTPLGISYGTCTLLDKLGVRWIFRHPAWWNVPTGLANLGDIDEIQEPSFIWREHFNPNPGGATIGDLDWLNLQVWKRRNRLGGPSALRIGHSYYTIMPSELYGQFPGAYLPEGQVPPPSPETTGWQLKPENPDVIAHANQFAIGQAANPSYFRYHTDHSVINGAIPISPNDGRNWGSICPDSGSTQEQRQALTNLVFQLVDEVAGYLHANGYPKFYASCYSYSLYSEVPTYNFGNPNVYVEIATAYDETALTEYQRIAGFRSRGALVGIRDYYDIYSWWTDMPHGDFDLRRLRNIRDYFAAGARTYKAERADSWASSGRLFYVSTRMLWDATLSVDEALDEFYTAAFGPAKATMKKYYAIWDGGQAVTNNSLGAAFNALHEAELACAGDGKYLERIRHMQYYMRYVWIYQNRPHWNPGETPLGELAAIWHDFVSRLRNLYIIAFRYVWEDAFHDVLRDSYFADRYPEITDPVARASAIEIDCQAWLNDNANYVEPTPAEASVWMAEALAALGSGVAAPYIDPSTITLAPKNVPGYPVLLPTETRSLEVMVLANNGETVECQYLTFSPYDNTAFSFYGPAGQLLDTKTMLANRFFTSGLNFLASAGNGIYKITTSGSVNVLSHPASMVPGRSRPKNATDLYFYVPEGTPSILVEFLQGSNPSSLYDPNGILLGTSEAAISRSVSIGVAGPAAGLWKVHYGVPTAITTFKIYGVPDLAWHNPAQMLVQSQEAPPPTIAITVQATLGGTVDPQPGTYDIEVGQTLLLIAQPSTGYTFAGWAENGTIVNTSLQYTVVATQDANITAVFEQIPTPTWNLNIISTEGGTTTPPPGQYPVLQGTSIVANAIPDTDHIFVRWEENGVPLSSNRQITLSLTSNRTVTAVFQYVPPPVTHTLTIVSSEGGTTNPVAGQYTYNEGTTLAVAALPSSGWMFVRWEENGVSIGTNQQIDIVMNANRSITPVFEEAVVPPTQYLLNLSVAQGQGSLNPGAGSYTVDAGVSMTIDASPASGWQFSHWQGDISGINPHAAFTVTGNMSVAAIFSVKPSLESKTGIAIAGTVAVGILLAAILRKRRK